MNIWLQLLGVSLFNDYFLDSVLLTLVNKGYRDNLVIHSKQKDLV